MAEVESEAELRAWLRAGWEEARHAPLIWVEAARGGTNGAPDVFVPTKSYGYIPVELKFWKTGVRGKVSPTMRPAQRRLHKMVRFGNQRSAILAAYRSSIFVGDSLRFVECSGESRMSGMTECKTVEDFRRLLELSSSWEEHWKRNGRVR
jgi:hypothetical protein